MFSSASNTGLSSSLSSSTDVSSYSSPKSIANDPLDMTESEMNATSSSPGSTLAPPKFFQAGEMKTKLRRSEDLVPKTHKSSSDSKVVDRKKGKAINNQLEKISTAFFYGISSLGIIFINKFVLGSGSQGYYGFPSVLFLALIQFLTTVLILGSLAFMNKVNITPFSPKVFKVMLPLALISSFNVVAGLGGTKLLNLPMMTCLRRFSILFTMILESIILKKVASKEIQLSVFLMIFGAFVAAYSDLTFNLVGYAYIFFNNILTASNGVLMKEMGDSLAVSKLGVLYYNSLMSIMIILPLLLMKKNEVEAIVLYPYWGDITFLCFFVLASLMGSVLNYATYLCTTTNSALTTTVVGCLKNILTAYLGMVSASYIFSWANFIGLNISILGSLYYSSVEFFRKNTPAPAPAPAINHNRSYKGSKVNDC